MKKKIDKEVQKVREATISIDKAKADQELRQNLLLSPDQLIGKTYTDSELDEYNLRQKLLIDPAANPEIPFLNRTESDNKRLRKKKDELIIPLTGGDTVNVKVLAAEWQQYSSQFHVELYIPMFRILKLEGNPESFSDRFKKEVANFTLDVIYGRFNKINPDVLPTLRVKNKYCGYYRRKHWHYQRLNKLGIAMLQRFIREAIEVMDECNNNYEFRQEMYKRYGLEYQIQLFN